MEYYLKAIRNYATFTGRSSRRDYWMYVLFNFIFSIAASILDEFLDLKIGSGLNASGIISTLYSLFVLIPGLAISIRRLHDINKSGWWILINLIPIIGWIWYFVLTVTEGTHGNNDYGKDPYGKDEMDLVDHLV